MLTATTRPPVLVVLDSLGEGVRDLGSLVAEDMGVDPERDDRVGMPKASGNNVHGHTHPEE